MKFGHFDDAAREYVITTPRTPLPWINYLGSEAFFSLVSHTAGGYSFYKDAKLRRITRYRYNNVPADSNGRYYYIKDGGMVWNPGWQPTQTELDFYECRHGLGYTTITGKKNGLAAKLELFVPVGDNCEIDRLVLTNESDAPKTFTVFSYLEFCLWNAVDDSTNFQRNFSTGEVEVEGSTIYHKTEYRERRDHYAFFTVNALVDGFDTSRDAFLGGWRSNADPEVVENGQCTNSVAHGWAPVGVHQINVTLQPGERRSLIFVLGYIENPEDEKWAAPGIINKTRAHALMARYATDAQVDEALAKLHDHWNNLLSTYSVKSGDEKLDRMVNIWNQYQCMVTFNMSRSASYYESGTGRGMGFRDSCQDLLGFVHLIPARARERILDIAATQFPDGSSYHQYQPLTKRGNMDIGSGFNDDPLWLIAAVYAYLGETGDYSILDEQVDFDNDPAQAKPLLEHLRRSFGYLRTHKGPHSLPLIGRADWNDCLNLNCFSKTPGESFQTTGPSDGPVAESVFIAGMYVKYGNALAEILDAVGNADEAADVRKEVADMEHAALTAGWDGKWFRRAYDAFGHIVGGEECEEGKIFIEPQGMCVMAGIGVDTGEAVTALQSVKEKLDTKYGIVLVQPAYTRYHLELGEISSYPPGYKENAGIFCHNNPWVSCAETVVGHGDRAFEIYKKTCPAYIEDISELHRTEPYVYSQMVAGCDAATFGEAKNSWLTGTAAWTFVDVSQYILGIQPTLAGLKIDPCILWNDGRTQKQVDYLNGVVGKDKLSRYTANIAFAGFTAPKLLWLRDNEPENFARIEKIMLPKDYINYKLTGVHCTDYSDASGMLLLDVEHKCWSRGMLGICGVTETQLPKLFESWQPVGTLTAEAAAKLGLPADVVVCAGAGDNAAAAVGCGAVGGGKCNISLGTSGTVFITSDTFGVDKQNALHSFAHADGGYHLMGCILSAASCNKWWNEEVLHTEDYAAEQAPITADKLGANDVYFLPYLMGERSPHNDPAARGAFIGLRMDTPRAALTQAVLEGVAFAIRDCVEIARAQGVEIASSTLCGGGAKSPLWREILANVLGIPLTLPQTEQGPGYGGAMLAAVACGAYPSVQACAEALVHAKKTTEPDATLVKKYNARYVVWHKLYPALKASFAEMEALQ